MFVNLLEPHRHTRLVDATQMIGAQRLVEQGWDVCSSYLDGYYGEPTDEARREFASVVERTVASLPVHCVVLTAGIPLAQRDPLRFVCSNSAVCGMGAVPIPYWFEDQSHSVPFANRRNFAAFQGAVASNRPLRAAVVEEFAGCERAACRVNENYFHSLSDEDRRALSASYWQLLSETQFSLCPRGDNCGSVRFYESFAAGCIPVLLADGAELPLARLLPWDDMIVRVPESEARHWQTHVERWKGKRTDEELASLSQHNRQTWRDWFHWSQLGKQLTVERVERAIAAAERRESKLSREALSVPGMASGKVRHLLNNLAARRYLEVGVWKGATFVAACYGRRLESATGQNKGVRNRIAFSVPDTFVSVTVTASCCDTSKSTNVTVVKYSFDRDPIKTGYEINLVGPNKPLIATATVTADPASGITGVTLVVRGQPRIELKIVNTDLNQGTIKFTVGGKTATDPLKPLGDTWIDVKHDGHVCQSVPVLVVIPKAIGPDHPQPNGAVVPENKAANATSTPKYTGPLGLNQVYLWTIYAQWLNVPVNDQFGNRLDAIYQGQKVYEKLANGTWRYIWQDMAADGTYLDPVFAFTPKAPPPVIVGNNTNAAKDWVKPATPPMPLTPGMQTQNIDIRIDGHTLTTGIVNRVIEAVAPNIVNITWP